MARQARKHMIDPSRVQILHCWNRCTRALALCGIDPLTGIDRDYRRGWSRDRLEHLASIFAIEVLTYSVMSTHTHQVLRSRPDLARQWTPEEVARRWLMLTPKRGRDGKLVEPSIKRILAITSKPDLVEKLRIQLSDVSWWMRSYAQHIATRANREDGKQGHFWEQRFKMHVLLDEASILRCMMYVDLNPIRAGMADSIEDSDYTGAKDRLDDLRIHIATDGVNQMTLRLDSSLNIASWERLESPCSGWLSPIQIDTHRSESDQKVGVDEVAAVTVRRRRASQRGAARISLPKYLMLLDLLGRVQRDGGSGFIPAEISTVLEQLNIEPIGFFESVLMFGRHFKSANQRPIQTGSSSELETGSLVIAV